MTLRSALTMTLGVILIGGALVSSALASEKEGAKEGPKEGGEIQAKLSGDYIAIPRLHMAVQMDANRKYRSLEVEVWLLQADLEKHQAINSKKKQISAQMKQDFAAYNWEAFEDSTGGPMMVKRIVAASVEHASGVGVQDVMIKTLVLK